MRTFIVHWYGPYSTESLPDQTDWGNGLYLIAGKQAYQRTSEIQYCGITEGTFQHRITHHHKVDSVVREKTFWFGEFEYPKRVNRSVLETAEKILIWFWQPDLNERKRISNPEPTTLLNFWFKPDGSYRTNQQRIYRDLSDVISWDGEKWRTGNLKVWFD